VVNLVDDSGAVEERAIPDMSHIIVWSGQSGTGYSFLAQPLDEPPGEEGGVYVFARRNPTGDGWVAICVGETESFSEYLPAHPMRQCARNHAATHLHLMTQRDEAARRTIVRDLIARWHPPCNQTLIDTIGRGTLAASGVRA
jgi:hypothetical protein